MGKRGSNIKKSIDKFYYMLGSKVFWAIIISSISLIITIALSPDALEELREIYLVIVTNVITVFIVYFIFQFNSYKSNKKRKK